MKWDKVKLGDVCTLISDGDHKAPPQVKQGIPFVTIANITTLNHFDFSNTMYVTQEYYDTLQDKRKAKKGDILYSVVGSFGIPIYIKEETSFVFQRHIAILRPDKEKIVPHFLYYVMKSRDFYMQADTVAIGAAQRTISLTSLRNMEICIPDLVTQKRISEILSCYDELIEKTQKQIKLLEEAAQRLYKEWFVDLRFPGHEDTKIIDGVPEKWDKEAVGDVIRKITRTKQIKTFEYRTSGAIPVIDQSRDFIAGYTNDIEALINMKVPVIVFGDHTRILKYVQFPFAKGADGTQLIVSSRDNLPPSLMYLSLVALDLSNYHYARHFKYLKEETILLPTKDIADEFDRNVSPMLKQIQILRDISQKAVEARDRLLPKLMSGELEV